MVILFVFALCNFAFTPYQIAFQLEYSGISILLEVCLIIVLISNVARFQMMSSERFGAFYWLRTAHLILVACPFAVVFSLA